MNFEGESRGREDDVQIVSREEVSPIEPEGEDRLLNYIEGPDLERIFNLAAALFMGADKDRICEDPELLMPRHPLWRSRVGKDVAADVAICDLIRRFTEHLVGYSSLGDVQEMSQEQRAAETARIKNILLRSAKDSESLSTIIADFETTLNRLMRLNLSANACAVLVASVSNAIYYGMKDAPLMSQAQELVLYPIIRDELAGESAEELLKGLKISEKFFPVMIDCLVELNEGDHLRLKQEIEAEVRALEEWLKRERT